MRAVTPAEGVEQNKAVGKRALQLLRERTEGPASKGEAVYVRVAVCGGDVDSHLRIGDGWLVVQFVADNVDPKPELVHDCVGEEMRFSNAAHAVMQRDVQWEIQVVRRGCAARLDLERIAAEGLKGVGISPEEAEGETILSAAELAIPIWL